MNTWTSSFPDTFLKSYSALYCSLNLKARWVPAHFTDCNAQSLQLHCTYSTVCSLFYWASDCFQIAKPDSWFSFSSILLNNHQVNQRFTLAVWRMIWHSRRISLTALLQINGHVQRDVVSIRKIQRKATKLKRLRSWLLGESKSRVFSFRTCQVWHSSCKTITKPCYFMHL